MELWRTSSDYAVIQTLEQLDSRDKNHYLTDTYEAMLSQETIRLLFERFRSNLSLEEIKSTLWYQRKRLKETGTVRLYNKTRQYFE